MRHPSDARLLMLHALRLKGVARPDVLAERTDLGATEVAASLADLAVAGLVARRDGLLPGWLLTPAGRTENERLLVAELDATGTREPVERAYDRFRVVNPEVLGVCSRWQVRDIGGRTALNDHRDGAYDARVVSDLVAIHEAAMPMCEGLAAALDRYRSYGPSLGGSLARVISGDTDYFTKPVIPSYHTVWFELHEDLLVTLGLERAAEVLR